MVKTRHSHDTEETQGGDFISIEERSRRVRKLAKDNAEGSDDSGVIQFRKDGKQPAEELQLSPRSKRASAKRVSYVEDCIDDADEDADFGGRTRKRTLARRLNSDEDDKDDVSPKQAANYRGSTSSRPAGRPKRSLAITRIADKETAEFLARRPRRSGDDMVTHPSPSRQMKQEQLDDLDQTEPMGTRRSSRQRKPLYSTMNEKSPADTANHYDEDRPRRKRRRVEVEGEDDKQVDEHDDEQEDEPDEDGFTDMYSRVKRKRKVVKRDMYGMPIEESSEDDDSDDSDDSSDDDSDDDDDDDDDNDKDEEEDSGNKKKEEGPKSYYLRQNKPRTHFYNVPVEEKHHRRNQPFFNSVAPPRSPARRRRGKLPSYMSPARRSYMSPARRKHRKQTAFHGGSSSTSSSESSSDEERFQRRKAKSMMRDRNRCLPMNFDKGDLAGSGILRDRQRAGASLADIDPMNIDRSVTFESVGGLGKHIRALKEMIVFPLLYPEIFERFKINPPRGVLFYGPPGTGKTLVARALANECSSGERKVAFYMRKGADCLSKWVGESERQLRLLFDQAYQTRPSIIFFDEIDGLAPVRSSRQDQIHSSIVSTLLALMDGLDTRGEIVVIGATNRIDSIDPALRRPGRFDREFLFPLPSLAARSQILKINTKEWNPKLADGFVEEVAEKCVGYCGADIRALCTEAALLALRRRYPQIYTSSDKLQIDVSSINVSARDFFYGMKNIVPTAQRSVTSPGRALSVQIAPLLQLLFSEILASLSEIFPSVLSQLSSLDAPVTEASSSEPASANAQIDSDEDPDQMSIYEQKVDKRKKNSIANTPQGKCLNFTSYAYQHPSTHRPRVILTGCGDQGQTSHIAPAILHHLEQLPVHTLDLPALFAVSARSPEESCAQIFREARRTSPSIVYLPHINQWWHVLGDTVKTTLLTLIQDLEPSNPLLLLATSEEKYEDLDYTLQDLFESFSGEVITMRNPNGEERRNFFKDLLLTQAVKPPPRKKVAAQRMLEILPKAPPPEPRKLTERELTRLREEEEGTLRELRLFLRDMLNKLGQDRKFGIFTKPVEIEDVPDYYDIIKKPMDLATMMSKIDLHHYQCVREFMNDIDQITANALEYNPDKDPQSRVIRHRACALRDTAYAYTKAELDPEFEKTCLDIAESRKRREEDGTITAPKFYHTRPLNTGPLHPLAVTKHPTTSTNNNHTSNPSYSPVRSSLRLNGAQADELPPLEEVERKARLVRSLMKKQNSPTKNSGTSNNEDRLIRKANTHPRSSSDSKIGRKLNFKRNLSSSLTKKPARKNIWGASGYRSRNYRRRMRWRQQKADELDECENVSNDEANPHASDDENHKINGELDETSDMETVHNKETNAHASPPRVRHQSGGFSSGVVNGKISSPKHTEIDCLSIDVDMSSPKDGHKSPSSSLKDSQRSAQKSPRSDCQRSPRSESQRSVHRSPQSSPHSDHLYAQPMDEGEPHESPQRSYRPSIGQRSPRHSAGQRSPRRPESPRRPDSECIAKAANKMDQTSEQEIRIPKLSSLSDESAQKGEPVQGLSQETNSQDKQTMRNVRNEVLRCDSGLGSSESSADSNDSTGKAKELLKAHEARQDEAVQDSVKASTSSGTNQEGSQEKLAENENTAESDSPKFRVTRSRIQSRSQQKALEILQESSQPVLVDRERLVHLLDSVVELTEGYTVSRLEKLHSIFSQSIYQHRLEFDKTQMIQEMEQRFHQFTSHVNRQRNATVT